VRLRVLIEGGEKRFFASALDWPGWSRGGKSRDEALARLVEYGPRYTKSVGAAASKLAPPANVDELDVVLTVGGNKNVDFGVPQTVVDADREPLTGDELERQIKVLKAAWKAFDEAAADARGKELASGARGGGRSLEKIVEHVHEADRVYIGALGAKAPPETDVWAATQTAFIDALHAKVRGELPDNGPRGGARWPAPYAIRRSAWHALDHAWEIEDRSGDPS
jgi:hypothetical protein